MKRKIRENCAFPSEKHLHNVSGTISRALTKKTTEDASVTSSGDRNLEEHVSKLLGMLRNKAMAKVCSFSY